MNLTKRENIALWIGVITTVIPSMILGGFFPDFNVLPIWAWLSISISGGIVAGATASRSMIAGGLAGGLTGAGVALGVLAYFATRMALLDTEYVLKLEIAIGAIIGAAPGLWCWFRFAGRVNGD